ncbi:hypothetical protein [Halorubrum halodurans]|uniref:hypothetical protein n=1 Tax=Halorubrum halodurans TaxID=1383851 RepID=UPI00117BA686|nr:hypothetical protein [Halorubrum halodurans]
MNLSVEALLSILILLIAWMRVSTANRETAYEFEQRLKDHYGRGTDVKTTNNDEIEEIGVTVNQVFFQEASDFTYLLKRSFWPWQEIDGNTIFDINTEGFVIGDIDEFEETLEDNIVLAECRHENHDDHYILTVKGVPDHLYYRIQSFDVIFYYIANASLTSKYYSEQKR